MRSFRHTFLQIITLMLFQKVAFGTISVLPNQPINIQFNGLMAPYIYWRNLHESRLFPFALTSDRNRQPIRMTYVTSPSCRTTPPRNDQDAACMVNQDDSSQEIHYTAKYVPCGTFRSFKLTRTGQTSQTITVDGRYTHTSQCRSRGGFLIFRRLSLAGTSTPTSGHYVSNIQINLAEV